MDIKLTKSFIFSNNVIPPPFPPPSKFGREEKIRHPQLIKHLFWNKKIYK